MALKSTIYKVNLGYSDDERHRYWDGQLTVAKHPSENDERLMVRLLAFALFAEASTEFGKGLSDADEPDLVTRDDTGVIAHWIEVGQPSDRAILRAAGKAARVTVLAYGASTDIWWRTSAPLVARARHLAVLAIDAADAQAMAKLAERSMELYYNIGGLDVWMSVGNQNLQISLRELKAA
jgi:uncharacterized protein YaeQ